MGADDDPQKVAALRAELSALGHPWPEHLKGKSVGWLELQLRAMKHSGLTETIGRRPELAAPMTGEEVHRIRQLIGDAVGRSLTLTEMAHLIGLGAKKGGETYSRWEKVGPSGPGSVLLQFLSDGLTNKSESVRDEFGRLILLRLKLRWPNRT
jgi:hypothetical protein